MCCFSGKTFDFFCHLMGSEDQFSFIPCWRQHCKRNLKKKLTSHNERSSADSLFCKGNAHLYIFTLNSTHFSLSSYMSDTDVDVRCQTRHRHRQRWTLSNLRFAQEHKQKKGPTPQVNPIGHGGAIQYMEGGSAKNKTLGRGLAKFSISLPLRISNGIFLIIINSTLGFKQNHTGVPTKLNAFNHWIITHTKSVSQ